MTIKSILKVSAVTLLTGIAANTAAKCPDFLNQEVRILNSKKTINLCNLYSDNGPMLIVNTASKCGHTPQFEELETLFKKYENQGLQIVGVPSNSFRQEEAKESDTASICYINYGVTFTMTETSDVKGENASPIFQGLIAKSTAPTWNFNKYLVHNNEVIHYSGNEKPLNGKIEQKIEEILTLERPAK